MTHEQGRVCTQKMRSRRSVGKSRRAHDTAITLIRDVCFDFEEVKWMLGCLVVEGGVLKRK